MKSLYALGSYTDRPGLNTPGKGVSLLELDEEQGCLEEKTRFEDVKNPSYLCYDKETRLLLAATENDENLGVVTTFRLRGEGKIEFLSRMEGPGRSNCHVNFDREREWAFAASYGEGRLKAYSLHEGTLKSNILDHSYAGKGPNEKRQEQPHAHQAVLSPDKRHLYVADLGSDCLWIHDLEDLELPPRQVKTSPGLGPRHMAFHPVTRRLYVVCELIPTLLVFDWNEVDGTLIQKQEILTVEEKDNPKAQPSGIKIHPSGKTVALANRFTDTVTVFDINDETGLGENRAIFDSRGVHCRDLEFSLSGEWLMLAHQESGDIQLKKFDPETGRPAKRWGEAYRTGSPTCLVPVTLG